MLAGVRCRHSQVNHQIQMDHLHSLGRGWGEEKLIHSAPALYEGGGRLQRLQQMDSYGMWTALGSFIARDINKHQETMTSFAHVTQQEVNNQMTQRMPAVIRQVTNVLMLWHRFAQHVMSATRQNACPVQTCPMLL